MVFSRFNLEMNISFLGKMNIKVPTLESKISWSTLKKIEIKLKEQTYKAGSGKWLREPWPILILTFHPLQQQAHVGSEWRELFSHCESKSGQKRDSEGASWQLMRSTNLEKMKDISFFSSLKLRKWHILHRPLAKNSIITGLNSCVQSTVGFQHMRFACWVID